MTAPTGPPQIVARAESPAQSLLAFIAQELEGWGFDITTPGTINRHHAYVEIEAEGHSFHVEAIEIGE